MPGLRVAPLALVLLLLVTGSRWRAAAQNCSQEAQERFKDDGFKMKRPALCVLPANGQRAPAPRLVSVPAGCVLNTQRNASAAPAPPAGPFDFNAHFGKCKPGNSSVCPKGDWNNGACVNAHTWCVPDASWPKASKDAAPAQGQDFQTEGAMRWCCCTPPCAVGLGGKTVISRVQSDEPHIKQIRELSCLNDSDPQRFRQKTMAFVAALDAGGVFGDADPKDFVANTLRPPTKTLVMYVVSCIVSSCKNKGGNRSDACADAFCVPGLKRGDAAAWAAVDAAAMVKVREAQSGHDDNSWKPEEVKEAEEFFNKYTFACAKPGSPSADGASSFSNIQDLAALYDIAYPASLTSNHMRGWAMDMTFTPAAGSKAALSSDCTWPAGGSPACPAGCNATSIAAACDQATRTCPLPRVLSSTQSVLWDVACTYGVIKMAADKPHWSYNGH